MYVQKIIKRNLFNMKLILV